MIPLRDTIRSRSFPVVTWLILGLNAFVFFTQLQFNQPELYQFVDSYALVPSRAFSAPQTFVLTVFTSMFMHAGWWHFISNMWILFIFGDNVEDRLGKGRYVLFYLGAGIAAALLQTFFNFNSMLPMLGASGAIAGVLGAYLVFYPGARVVTLIPLFFLFTTINIPAFIYLGIWFIGQLFSGVASIGVNAGGVAWWAHIGGFLFGLIIGPLLAPRRQVEIIQPRYDIRYY